MPKRHSEEFINKVVEQYKSGTSVKELCEQHNISRSTLFLWVKQHTPNEIGKLPRDLYLLEKEVERLRIENRIYKVCGCSAASPLADRLVAIAAHKNDFSIHALCRVLEVNRSTFYHYDRRSPDVTAIQKEDTKLKPLISDIFAKSHGIFGARKIRVKLKEKGYTVSEHRILRLMKELGLPSKGKRPKINSANDRQYQYYPNRVKRKFLTDAPNKVWISDITYAKVGSDFLYLCTILDLYSRKVLSYNISDRIDTGLTLKTFHEAFARRNKPTGLIFHSDQGVQYTSYEFRSFLKCNGVIQSFSAPGNPYDNAVAERFFSSVKDEDLRRNFYETKEEFQTAMDRYIDFYNNYRPHQRMGFLTPNQVEREYRLNNAYTI